MQMHLWIGRGFEYAYLFFKNKYSIVSILSNVSGIFPRVQVLEQVDKYVHVLIQNSKHWAFLAIMISRLLLLSAERLVQTQSIQKESVAGSQIAFVNIDLSASPSTFTATLSLIADCSFNWPAFNLASFYRIQ